MQSYISAFKVLKASFASGDNVTGWFFNFALSHPIRLLRGFSYLGVVLDESSKVACGANELSYTGDGFRVTHFSNLLNTFLTRQHSCGGDFMSQIRQTFLEEVAF